jgi:predicted DNA-binding transcriptional regulator AlpA
VAAKKPRTSFLKGIKLGENKVGWLDAEVSAWLADRMAERFDARAMG